MANEDGPLIDLIRQYPWLYDKQEKQYRNKNAKQNAWQMIANILKTNPEDCEQRWIVLRNRFCTELRNMKTRPSGSGATTSSWHLFEAMSFLSDFIIPRKSRGNFARPPQKHQTQADVNHVDIWDSYSTIIYNNQSQDSDQQSSDVEMSTQETEGTSSTASSSTTQHNLPSCSGIQTKNNQKRKASEDGDVITKETEGTTHQNVPSCSGVQMNNDQRMKVNEKRKVMTDIENTSNQFIKDKKKKKEK
ncbi:unnamed protein product [Phaedon cochleariae]|uniref:MADF domain-containing protein n=1 Tax=Phaedon cochleariae TaxID=80249 RepID=A0A9P0GTZ6_PHACE|nr:unnamed protein product [Phaedon cochleariae]